jgi:catechol 2,3-dioxygenase-like lactoylglutathione lyase family enzyme
MTAQLNHTIVYSSDRAKSARFLAEILGLRADPGRCRPGEINHNDGGRGA